MPVSFLGMWPLAREMSAWILPALWEHGLPLARVVVGDPHGTLRRFGDLIIWDGAGGRQVVAGIEALNESQQRIEQAIVHIESAQTAAGHSLSALTGVSIATLGLGAFAVGFMTWRMEALSRRLRVIGDQISDVIKLASADLNKHLPTAIDFLESYQRRPSPDKLGTALLESRLAVNAYAALLSGEVHGQQRLLVLHHWGRMLLFALTVECRSAVLANELADASAQINSQRQLLKKLVSTSFQAVLGKSPEVYLDPAFQVNRVTLNTLTELYQQADLAGVELPNRPVDANATFERLRPSLSAARITGGLFSPKGSAKQQLLANLNYLTSCIEETNRVLAIETRIEDARSRGYTLDEVEREVKNLQRDSAGSAPESHVFAYAMV